MGYNKAMRERKRFTEKAKRLRELRERAGYTITELSLRSGVAENVISRVELHGYIPTEKTIRKLAAVLGDEVWELFRVAESCASDAPSQGGEQHADH
jgi:transcriptional regulator with XRE-family HTH domain